MLKPLQRRWYQLVLSLQLLQYPILLMLDMRTAEAFAAALVPVSTEPATS